MLYFFIGVIKMIVKSIEPVIDNNSKILILGSMPGSLSLQKQQYYAHPKNWFWQILFALFDTPFTEDYGQKLRLLIEHKVALWDTIASCEREGSLDKNIKNETPNDIMALIKDYPNIRHIICNGQKSFAVYRKYFAQKIDLPLTILPSTSPIPRKTIRGLNDLLTHWVVIKDYLE